MALTVNVIAQGTIAEQVENAWKTREGLLALDNDPTFCQIVDELSDPTRQRVRKAFMRGYPRYAFTA